MQYFPMIGGINTEMVERFIEFYNKGHDRVKIIMNSTGGNSAHALVLVSMIKEMKDVTLVIQGCYSAAFLIAIESKCKIHLVRGCTGMFHYSTIEIHMNDRLEPAYQEGEAHMQTLRHARGLTESIAKKVMTSKEYKKFKLGSDVYFDINRMKQIFPNATII